MIGLLQTVTGVSPLHTCMQCELVLGYPGTTAASSQVKGADLGILHVL